MISWKHSFEKISKDLELTKKKKQTLDNLFNAGKISQSTYDSLNMELSKSIAETEARQKELAGQMSSKVTELEEQINTLEMLLASSELQYAAGEIDDELYTHESKAFGLGLEATKQELNAIKNIIASIMQETTQPQPQLEPQPQFQFQPETHEIKEAEPPKPEEVIAKPPETTIVETPIEKKPIEPTTETQPETPAQMPTETPPETPTEAVTETKIETPPETSTETPTSPQMSAPETPSETPKETAPSEEVTIEIIKEVKEEQVITSEPVSEKVEESRATESAQPPTEETTFFRDPKKATEEKTHEKKEEPKE